MRGIAHALNNRAAALSAVIELSREPDEDPPVVESILGIELQRVTELAAAVRSIGAPRGGVEAFSPHDAAAEALAALKLYVDRRDLLVTIDATSATPIRVPRWMFVRALIALGATAGKDGADARISAVEDGDWLIVAVRAGASFESPCVTELARAMGGGPLEDGRGFRVPTLSAVRQREGH